MDTDLPYLQLSSCKEGGRAWALTRTMSASISPRDPACKLSGSGPRGCTSSAPQCPRIITAAPPPLTYKVCRRRLAPDQGSQQQVDGLRGSVAATHSLRDVAVDGEAV